MLMIEIAGNKGRMELEGVYRYRYRIIFWLQLLDLLILHLTDQ